MSVSKNLNLKVSENLFYEFHRLKGYLKAGTNQECLHKLLLIADEKMKELRSKTERDVYISHLSSSKVSGS